ncbi:hypothetical protein ACVMFA_007268 [Bradyrhizobium liaoningense]|nr:hypothetical protein GCM10007858_71610 [Bradyrhizobium liaoningense]
MEPRCKSCGSHPFVNEKERTMRPTTADDNVFDFDALLHPGTVFETPKDVLDHLP